MNTCYHCGRTIEDENLMVMKEINVGFLELQNTRQPFHSECWKKWRREKRMTTIKQLLGIFIAFMMFLVALHFLTGWP